MDFTSALLRGSEHAVRQYNEMSSAMWAPEGYIRDMCAMYIHQQLKVPISIEVPRKYFQELWGFDINACEELGNFKVDLATHQVHEEGRQTVATLIEFKLYTGDGAETDIKRLHTLMKIAASTGARVEGYLVICEPAYPKQKMKHVQKAFDDFSKKFRIAEQTLFEIDESKSRDSDGVQRPGRWPVGVAVIDVADDTP